MPNPNDPAFPRSHVAAQDTHNLICVDQGESGMTLRQWYAGMAMQGILSSPKGRVEALNSMGGDSKALAKGAFIIADDMIAYENEEGKK